MVLGLAMVLGLVMALVLLALTAAKIGVVVVVASECPRSLPPSFHSLVRVVVLPTRDTGCNNTSGQLPPEVRSVANSHECSRELGACTSHPRRQCA